jgi:homoaconitase/3-isopropylmalate dehydratase large subunit
MVMSKDVILYIAGKYGTDVAQYKAIEFTGQTISDMSVSSRITISVLAVELGAKAGLVAPDEKTVTYLKNRTNKPFKIVRSDSDCQYEKTYSVEVSKLEPQVACPHDVSNVKPVSQVEGKKIDQAFIGTCTNGRLEDIEAAAKILKNRKVNPDVRMIVTPASREVYIQAMRAGYIEILLEAGAVVTNPQCGSCAGYIGMLNSGEVCITSQNRNFKGRMGSADSELYLASPATVAASAIKGMITDPREFM